MAGAQRVAAPAGPGSEPAGAPETPPSKAPRSRSGRAARRPCAFLVVQNLPVPLDRRVWQEAQTLRDAGFAVTVICPKAGEHRKGSERRDGVEIRRFDTFIAGRSTLGIVCEYVLSALAIFLTVTIEAARRRPDVVQVCNPPDFLAFLVLHLRTLFRTKIIFDHHDLCPELYEAKFGKRGLLYDGLCLLERATFRMADVVISNNASFAEVAQRRGRVSPDRIWIAHSYIKGAAALPPPPVREEGRKLTIGYLGVIGSQDGVDTFVAAAARLLSGPEAGRIDIVVVGDGPELPALKRQAAALGVAGRVRFTGFLTGAALREALAGFDIAVAPDPPNALNSRLSMNKVFECLAVGAPIVHLGLAQAGADAGPCGVKAVTPDAAGLAAAIEGLIRDPAARARMREEAVARARGFSWESQEPSYLGAYRQALEQARERRPRRTVAPGAPG